MTDKNGFAEIREQTSPSDLEQAQGMQEFDGVDDIPLDDKWSWNPVDWYLGIKHELQTFSLEINERKRVVIHVLDSR